MSDHSNQTVLENHTGNLKNFKNKQEVPYMFDPQTRVNYVNGTPVYEEELVKRFNASNKKQQELPIKQVRVGPGLNQGYSSTPCGGLNQSNKRDYIMPKTVDELRVLTNPKNNMEVEYLLVLRVVREVFKVKLIRIILKDIIIMLLIDILHPLLHPRIN